MTMESVNISFKRAWIYSLAQFLLISLTLISQVIESIVSRLIHLHESYIFNPLETRLTPSIERVPRSLQIRNKYVVVFNANLITIAKTSLIIPIAWLLKWEYSTVACGIILFNGFLNYFDEIVARVQKDRHGQTEHECLSNEFLQPFCSNILHIFCLWSILHSIHLNQTSIIISMAFVSLCYTVIALETILAVLRVQDYFYALYKNNNKSTLENVQGKFGELIEILSLSFLSYSTGYDEAFRHWSAAIGTIGLFLTVRFAYGSMIKVLEVQKHWKQLKKTVTIDSSMPSEKTIAVMKAITTSEESQLRKRSMTLDSSVREMEKRARPNTPSSLASSPAESNSSIASLRTSSTPNKLIPNPFCEHLKEIDEDKAERSSTTSSTSDVQESSAPCIFQRSASLPAIWIDSRADKVYTVGCFDLFHDGHRILLQRMRQYGREVIVGVHDSRSIHKLKSRVPVDGTETRMLNVRRYADQVFCVAGTDPSNFITCIVHLRENETAVYVRGDDMADFPSRKVVEELMTVKFLPYTAGVSSTQIRKDMYSHIQANDIEHLEKIN